MVWGYSSQMSPDFLLQDQMDMYVKGHAVVNDMDNTMLFSGLVSLVILLWSWTAFHVIDVWRGIWRCTHARLAPLTPHPLPRIATTSLRRDKGGTLWGRQPFCPHFSSASQVCGWCDYTLPSFRNSGSSLK